MPGFKGGRSFCFACQIAFLFGQAVLCNHDESFPLRESTRGLSQGVDGDQPSRPSSQEQKPGLPVGSAEVCTGENPCVGLGACPGTCGTHLFPLLIQWQTLPLKPQLMQSGGHEVSA